MICDCQSAVVAAGMYRVHLSQIWAKLIRQSPPAPNLRPPPSTSLIQPHSVSKLGHLPDCGDMIDAIRTVGLSNDEFGQVPISSGQIYGEGWSADRNFTLAGRARCSFDIPSVDMPTSTHFWPVTGPRSLMRTGWSTWDFSSQHRLQLYSPAANWVAP